MKSTTLRTPALCLGLLTLAACGKGKEQGPSQMPPPQVGVITVQPQNVPLTKDLVGRLSAYRSADVRARVSGVLLKRAYVEGSEVKKGQLLFQVDPQPYKAALTSALASLASAKATYANAHANADRDRSLIGQGYVSRQQLDDDEATERTAAASVKEEQADVETARINLGYTQITAPIDGRAGEQQVTEGAIVGTSTSDAGTGATLLTTIDQIDPLYVNFTLSVNDLDQMRSAQGAGSVTLSAQDQSSVQVTLPDGSPYPELGKLDFSSPTVDPSTGAVDMRAVIPNPKYLLLPGMYVTIKAKLGEQHKVFLVPQAAVQRDTVSAYVYVVGKDGKVVRRNVVLGNVDGSDWIVTSGLDAGDQVIVSGVQNVKEGASAKAVPWQAPSPAAGQATTTPASAAHGQ